jgi:hypothetical protein
MLELPFLLRQYKLQKQVAGVVFLRETTISPTDAKSQQSALTKVTTRPMMSDQVETQSLQASVGLPFLQEPSRTFKLSR